MNYTVRLYKEETDGQQALKLLKAWHHGPKYLDEIRGVGAVAIDDKTHEIIGFAHVLVGHASFVYWDNLVTETSRSDREDIAIDVGVFLLSLLKRAGVKKIYAAIQNEKLQRVLELIGFEPLNKHVTIVGDMEKISSNISSYFNGKSQGNADIHLNV
mgnify:CR=1 FL=1